MSNLLDWCFFCQQRDVMPLFPSKALNYWFFLTKYSTLKMRVRLTQSVLGLHNMAWWLPFIVCVLFLVGGEWFYWFGHHYVPSGKSYFPRKIIIVHAVFFLWINDSTIQKWEYGIYRVFFAMDDLCTPCSDHKMTWCYWKNIYIGYSDLNFTETIKNWNIL